MSDYVDIHTHILPAIDDGPRTMAESVELARTLVSAGFDTVVATPHTGEGQSAPALILERLQELQVELKRLGIPLEVLPGAEHHIEPATLERLRRGEILTLNNSRHLLLELPFFQPLPIYTMQLISDLSAAGYVPVIPHPERATALLEKPQLIFELYRAGALFQVTWGALTGKLGPEANRLVKAMLAANLAHFFATDAHHAGTRLLQLEKAAALLEQEKGSAFVTEVLSTRPRRLITGRLLELPPAEAPPERGAIKTSFISRFRRTIGH